MTRHALRTDANQAGIVDALRKAGATIPVENRGTIEIAIKNGLSIALLLVEDALAKNGGAA